MSIDTMAFVTPDELLDYPLHASVRDVAASWGSAGWVLKICLAIEEAKHTLFEEKVESLI
jgi:hypothetical protein